jgi:hypothetical protein
VASASSPTPAPGEAKSPISPQLATSNDRPSTSALAADFFDSIDPLPTLSGEEGLLVNIHQHSPVGHEVRLR